MGLLRGLQLTTDGKPIVADCLQRGVLINCTADRVLRFMPALTITQAEIDRCIDVLTNVLSKHV
jgi:acetylornithine/succinyldiaminopimelate/putrescine aminotransferase